MQLSILLYCRAGFEKECAAEIIEYAASFDIQGYVNAKENSAHVLFHLIDQTQVLSFWKNLHLEKLIFSRQILLTTPMCSNLPEKNRTNPILEYFEHYFLDLITENRYLEDLFVETFDTDEYKEILSFCKKFTSPMVSALKNKGYILRDINNSVYRLHLVFLDSRSCFIGLSLIGRSSKWYMGIPRLKFPENAPSRSTLKLEEAFLTFMSEADRATRLQPGMKAIDLGASPGGWTYQFVKRSIYVYAIDNGAMDKSLLNSGLVEHLQEDGFKFIPKKPVHWLVCDMVEKPFRIAQLIAERASCKIASEFIFNLKLPMKKKYDEVKKCITYIEENLNSANIKFNIKCKQLYHDRDEVTVWLYVYGATN
jgi:23S rRNA (cytidine2498-2'-O)-methyltransferase